VCKKSLPLLTPNYPLLGRGQLRSWLHFLATYMLSLSMAMDIPVPKAAVKSRALEKAVLKGIRPPAGEEEGKPRQAYAKEKNPCPVKIDYTSN
jgi:hypothetical protein